MTSARIAPRARREVSFAVRWIAADDPGAAQAFRRAIKAAAERIGQHPAIGRVRTELATERFRFVGLIGFPYSLVYVCQSRPPVIARIVHASRDLPEVLSDL